MRSLGFKLRGLRRLLCSSHLCLFPPIGSFRPPKSHEIRGFRLGVGSTKPSRSGLLVRRQRSRVRRRRSTESARSDWLGDQDFELGLAKSWCELIPSGSRVASVLLSLAKRERALRYRRQLMEAASWPIRALWELRAAHLVCPECCKNLVPDTPRPQSNTAREPRQAPLPPGRARRSQMLGG